MSKHTPGPWNWYQPQSTASVNPYSAAFVLGPKRVPMDRSEGFTAADAKLISAAPDLLSALQAITNSGPDAIPIKEAFEMAHRAIERASGGSV